MKRHIAYTDNNKSNLHFGTQHSKPDGKHVKWRIRGKLRHQHRHTQTESNTLDRGCTMFFKKQRGIGRAVIRGERPGGHLPKVKVCKQTLTHTRGQEMVAHVSLLFGGHDF